MVQITNKNKKVLTLVKEEPAEVIEKQAKQIEQLLSQIETLKADKIATLKEEPAEVIEKQAKQIEQLLSQIETLKADKIATLRENTTILKDYRSCSAALEHAYKQIEGLQQEIIKLHNQLKDTRAGKTLIVEDGSIDIEDAEDKGWDILVYRQGATPPRYIARW